MADCLGGVDWDSRVPDNGSKEKAKLKIKTQDADGFFTGKFKEGTGPNEDIFGHCSATDIWFIRVKKDPPLMYSGKFVSDKRIEGERDTLFIPFVKGKRSRKKPLAPDDWTAEKTT